MSRNRTETIKHVGQISIDTNNHVANSAKRRPQVLDLRPELTQLLLCAEVTTAVANERPRIRLDLDPSRLAQQADAGHRCIDRHALLSG